MDGVASTENPGYVPVLRPLHPQSATGVAAWDARTDAKRARQRVVLEGIAAGKAVKEACKVAGVHINTYQGWRDKDPWFRAEAERAKAHRGQGDNLQNFAYFRKKYFGLETFPHQAQLVDSLEHVEDREIVLINIWPESGKTTTVCDWICQQLALNPNLRITMTSASAGLCRKAVGHIKQRMTDTGLFGEYIAAFGPFHDEGQERKGKPWAADYFTVARAHHDEKDYSLEARAITSNVYGTRIDILIVDDVQAIENLGQTAKILAHLRQTYLSRGLNMRVVILGTRIGNGDIYEALIDADIVDRYISIPAVQSDGSVTCPELWGVPPTRDAWQKKKEFRDCDTFDEAVAKRIATIRSHSGEPGWWAGYQQNPSVNELATFTDDNIDDAKDYQRGIGAGEAGDYVALSLDPALGGGNALTAAVHGVDLLTVLDQKVTYNLARVEDILNGIEEFARLYFPQILIVERDSFQKSLAGDLRLAALSARYGFHVLPHTTTRNKADPLLGVASMASSFILKEVRLPWGDELARSRMDALVGQLRAWRPTVATKLLTQDAVMSLWFNWRYWTENKMARGDGDMHSSWNRGGTPYAPTPYATVTV